MLKLAPALVTSATIIIITSQKEVAFSGLSARVEDSSEKLRTDFDDIIFRAEWVWFTNCGSDFAAIRIFVNSGFWIIQNS